MIGYQHTTDDKRKEPVPRCPEREAVVLAAIMHLGAGSFFLYGSNL